ncbi:TolC family protein [Serpentinicella alkaliphila]|uniref:Outer membrane efflux protein n=1 Tax=Serpentinicella alkaliphila TaxID=1734049 RepID=A0A4R2T5Q4_9FIRM|nr:TolC family protein [Serpentinicella alkaliphila]QUH25054.1 TolC family protein [Serpentinicella alkaliphila]TCP98419.1 outer membrane efflux protein [Serpentinicella alkaliphila]
MIRLRKISIVTVLILSIIFSSGSFIGFANGKVVKTITIENALEMARKNNASIKYTELNKDKMANNIGNLLTSLNNSAYHLTQAIELENTRLNLISKLEDESLTSLQKENIRDQLSQVEALLSSTTTLGSSTNQLLDSLEQSRISQQMLIDNEVLEGHKFDYSIENQYIGLLILNRNIIKLEKNYEITKQVLEIERLKQSLGLSSLLNLEDTFLRFNHVASQLKQLKLQQEVVINNYKKILGVSEGIELILEPVSYSGIKYTNYTEGLKNALSGRSIQIAEKEIQRREEHLINVNDRYPDGTNKSYNPQVDLREAKYRLEDLKNSIEMSYKLSYNDLIQKENEIKLAEQSYNTAKRLYELSQLRYTIGLMSIVEVDNRKIDYETKEIDLENAKDEYYKAYRVYEYIQKGIMVNR